MIGFSEQFWAEAARWSYETGNMASSEKRMEHPSAQIILGMGVDALPYLLSAFRVIPDDWSLFLNRIVINQTPIWTASEWMQWAWNNRIEPAEPPAVVPGRVDTLLDVLRLMRGDQQPTGYRPPPEDMLT